jgi:plastocyanin
MRSLAILAATFAVLAAAGSAAAAPALSGTVGPGFTITLKTAAGKQVRELEAGAYTIVVRDRSGIHNFHLTGPGLNKATSVTATGTTTWRVRLARGSYRYVCDPHRTLMKGSFRVS